MSKPLKHNYLKQLVGRTENNDNHRRYSNRRESFKTPIMPKPSQQRVLENLFVQETRLYNNFVSLLQTRLKGQPDFLKSMTERHRLLFCIMSRLVFDIRTLTGKKSEATELPKDLETFRDILFGIRGDKELGMSESMSIFYEACANKALVLADTRECMAYELIEFYYDLADTRTQSAHMLESVTPLQKRHLQIRKEQIEITWNEKKEVSEIQIPHLRTPLIMEADINYFPQWSLMIIHKDPNVLDIGRDINWEIDFRNTRSKYLVKYIETPNPISKMKSRFVGNR